MRALARLVFVLGTIAGCGGRAPGWHVDRGFLRAPDGRAAILRGMNVSGTQKSAPYLDDKTEADYERIRAAWGMNAIRFLMVWAAVEPSAGVYDDAYLDGVAARMRWAQSYGLSVVLDMHQDVYGEGFGFDGAPRWTCDAGRYAAFVPVMPWFLSTQDPNVEACVDDFYTRADLQEHFVAAWRHVAERLAAEPAIVGFDVLNEPEWGTYSIFDFEPDRLQPFYGKVVRAVRGAAPGWVAFLEPSSSRNAGIATSLTAFDFADVVYAPHSYDSAAEGGGGFDPSHRQQILDNVAKLADEATALHAALWIGEYGGVATAPGIVEYMTAQYDAAGQAAAGSAYWAYDDGGYGPINADGSERPELVGAIARPYPARVAGDPIGYAFDAATSTFSMSWTPDTSAKLPTEIVVPARAYPSGWSVDCAGCATEMRGDELVVTTPPTDRPATLRIHP
jgi:endoglycosylceramidase